MVKNDQQFGCPKFSVPNFEGGKLSKGKTSLFSENQIIFALDAWIWGT